MRISGRKHFIGGLLIGFAILGAVPRSAAQQAIAPTAKELKGYGSFQSAWRTLQDIETVHMIRKGRVRWLAKGDALGQASFITDLFGVAA